MLPKIRRVPSAIGIGMAKCGTGTLGFLDCHPNIVFRGTEPRYFNEESIVNQIIRAWRSNNRDRYGIFQVNLKNRLKWSALLRYFC